MQVYLDDWPEVRHMDEEASLQGPVTSPGKHLTCHIPCIGSLWSGKGLGPLTGEELRCFSSLPVARVSVKEKAYSLESFGLLSSSKELLLVEFSPC